MDEFENIAAEIDLGIDSNDADRIEQTLREVDRLLTDELVKNNPTLHYYRANAFAGLRAISPDFQNEQFSWKQPKLTEEIFSLRRAVKCPDFERLNKIRRCQILTNLGNALDTVGRPIEAIVAWDGVLSIEPRFAMAAANRALGLTGYSAALYDPGHQCIFLADAADGFQAALSEGAVWDSTYSDAVKD